MKVVMVFGAFDGLHPRHLDFFKQAKKYGDFLVVSVGTDKNVKRIKSKQALFNQTQRLALVATCKIVDRSVLGAENNFYGHIKNYKPDVVCLGYDQWASEEEVKKGLRAVGLSDTRVVRLKPFRTTRAKSTIVKKRSVDF